MDKEQLPEIRQVNCDHLSYKQYTEGRFDILMDLSLSKQDAPTATKFS